MARSLSTVLVALAMASLAACGGDKQPVTTPAETISPPSPADDQTAHAAPPAQNAAPPAQGEQTARILARLVGRTGQWQATLGRQSDQGNLTIRFRCTGGGNLAIITSHGNKGVNSCDGGTKLVSESADVPPGVVTVTVEPDGDQRWSLYVARGPDNAGSTWWPKAAG